MPFDLEEFTQVFAPNDYIEVGFRQDSQSVAQLEKLLSKYFKQRQQYDEKQTQKNQKSFLEAIKDLKSKQNNELEKLKQLFSDVGNNINLSMKNSGENNRIILQRVAKVAQVALKGVEKQYAAGKKWVQTLSDLDEAGIITKNGFEEIREAATTAGLGLDEFKSVLLKSTKTISKFEAATGQGIISYGKAMKTLLDSGRYTARESAAMIDSYVASQNNLNALKGEELKKGLTNFAKTTKLLAMLQGEQVDQMLATQKQKSENLSIQALRNSNPLFDQFMKQNGERLKELGITEAMAANVIGGLKTVAVGETAIAMQNPFVRDILLKGRDVVSGKVSQDEYMKYEWEKGKQEIERENKISQNKSLLSVSANAPFLQKLWVPAARMRDIYNKDYQSIADAVEGDNETNQAKSWSRRFLRSLNNIFTNKDYLTTGGTQAYLGVLKPITKSTELASEAIDGFASGLSKLNKTIGEMEEGWGKYAAQLGLATGTGIVRGVGEYTTAQVGSYINSLIEGSSQVGSAYLIKQGLQSASAGATTGASSLATTLGASSSAALGAAVGGAALSAYSVQKWFEVDKIQNSVENEILKYKDKFNNGTLTEQEFNYLNRDREGMSLFGLTNKKPFGDWTYQDLQQEWKNRGINQPTYSEINKSKPVVEQEQKAQINESLNDTAILKEMKTTLNSIYACLSKLSITTETQTRFTPYNVNT